MRNIESYPVTGLERHFTF